MDAKTLPLSKYLNVERKKLEKLGVFDSTLGVDTKLFVDPKLLIRSNIEEFKNSRKIILLYFAKLLNIHKQSHKSPRLLIQARDMLAVKEPQGLSIGYGNKTDRGTAISKTLANKILLSASEILAVGIDDEELIETLGLFIDGFGPDSMSDLTVSIIYHDFCKYTQKIAKDLKVKTQKYIIDNKTYILPKHPFKETCIIFVPFSFLSPLPLAVSWDQIAEAGFHNRKLRNEFNSIIFPVLKEILTEIKEKSDEEKNTLREGFNTILKIYRKINVRGYDLKLDSKGYYSIQPFIEKESVNIKVESLPKTQEELKKSVRDLIKQFERSIESNGGNKLLYRKTKTGVPIKDSPHNEDVSQTIFYLIADLFCQKANILLSREPNAGLGPVDFSLGKSYDTKVLVEIKKSTNKDLEDGYLKQIKAYKKNEAAFYSFFIVIIVKEVQKTVTELNPQLKRVKDIYEKNTKYNISTPELVIIDGLIHPSPSKLRS